MTKTLSKIKHQIYIMKLTNFFTIIKLKVLDIIYKIIIIQEGYTLQWYMLKKYNHMEAYKTL